jgi:putative membrane protein
MVLKFALSTLATALGLLVVDILLKGVVIANFPAAIVAAVVIGLINTFIRPIVALLSLPITFLTLGAFALVINGLCFWLASILVPGFVVKGLVAFILGPVILSLASTFLNNYFTEKGAGITLPGANAAKELADSATEASKDLAQSAENAAKEALEAVDNK